MCGHMMPNVRAKRAATGWRQAREADDMLRLPRGPGAKPLALRLSEGLGVNADTHRVGIFLNTAEFVPPPGFE